MSTKVSVPTLESVFTDSYLSLKDITWDNVAVVGDNNIDAIISQIVATDKNFISKLEDFKKNNKLSETEKQNFEQSVSVFRTEWIESRKAIIEKLESFKTGSIKPLIPTLRRHDSYHGKHVVVYTIHSEEYNIKKTWRSAVAKKHSNYSGNERFHLNLFTSLMLEDTKDNFSANGHYWQVEITSPFVMSHEELLWWKTQREKEFTNLFFQNTNHREKINQQEILEIITSKDSTFIVDSFETAIQNFTTYCEGEDFVQNERDMRKIANHLIEEYGHLVS